MLPGSALLARVRVGSPIATVYTQLGNWWGWLCVAAGALLLGLGRWGRLPQAAFSAPAS